MIFWLPPGYTPAPPIRLPVPGTPTGSIESPRMRSFVLLPVSAALAFAALLLTLSPAGAQAGRKADPLPDGVYRGERGYNRARASCPGKIEIQQVKIAAGTIEFESGGSRWFGMINEKTGVIRIETTGITPRPTAPLTIRGHHAKAQLFSTVCGAGYFRVVR